jgi:hypothetical protein
MLKANSFATNVAKRNQPTNNQAVVAVRSVGNNNQAGSDWTAVERATTRQTARVFSQCP